MNERLKKIREALGFSQREFSQKINVGQSTLAMFETGQRVLKDIHISQICSVFKVSEEWLRDGVGEMFTETDSTIISKLSSEYNLDSLDKKIIESYLNLGEEQRNVIKNYVHALAEAIVNDEEIAATKENVSEEKQSTVQNEEDSIEKEVNAYRLELEAEKKGRISSVLDASKENLG